jgi:electron transfer flavoprotein beta subunit
MNSLICVSHVPDTTTRIKFTPDNKDLDKNGVTFIINPYEEFGLARALEFREGGIAGEIVAITVGDVETEPTLRKALAVGADRAVRVDAAPTDSYFVAKQIAEHAKQGNYDLIWLGKESIDYNGSEVAGLVAEMLDLPYVSFAIKVEVDGNVAHIERELDGGVEVLEVEMPVVISCQKGIAEWRIPNMRGIMAARTKKLDVVPAVEAPQHTQTLSYELPKGRGDVQLLDANDPKALVDILANRGVFNN